VTGSNASGPVRGPTGFDALREAYPMAQDQHRQQDPTEQHPKPSGDGEELDYPGLTGQMQGEPDHGEESYRGSGRLTGRKAVITGGDSGIGRAVALAYAREGADVLISHLESEESDAKETLRLVSEAGRCGISVPGDIREQAQCQRIVDRAVEEFGRIDVLVNNAAFQMARGGGIKEISADQFDRTLKTNLYAMFWLCQAALPHLRPGSCIINTSSVQAFQPSPHLLDYATTKAGIVNFTKGLALNLVEDGIRVNSVAPGPVWTPLIPATFPKGKVSSFGEQSPMGRAAQPAELAPVYVFLASQESSYITGEVLGVTGGKPIT
jgi:NAD(P)-dependent dehydrogenase (short-subunit alcohol dehydrogenase family)